MVYDAQEPEGLKVIDLGAGHSSSNETLAGRVLAALKSEALLNESVGAGYLERNWPPALKSEGAWPLASLRQSFLNGSLTRLVDPDAKLKEKIVEFVARGDFGLASGRRQDGAFQRIWFRESVSADEVVFEADVFLLLKSAVEGLIGVSDPAPVPAAAKESSETPRADHDPATSRVAPQVVGTRTLRLAGAIPPEVWNRFGTKLLPKLRGSGAQLRIAVDLQVQIPAAAATNLSSELRQILQDLALKLDLSEEG